MRIARAIPRAGRPFAALAAATLALLAAAVTARGQDDASQSTYRVILYIAADGAPQEMRLQRLEEVWTPEQGLDRLRALLDTQDVRRLEDVTVLPSQDTPALKVGNVTVRVKGAYKEPKHDAMFLRVEADGGTETLVKEMISKFDETIVLAYPLAEGNRTIVALIVPTKVGS